MSIFDCNEILYAADKYDMKSLTIKTFNYLKEKEVNMDTFWVFFKIITSFDKKLMDPKMLINVWDFLDNNAAALLPQPGFEKLNWKAVSAIVQTESLDVDELIIFHSIIRWSKQECCRRNLQITTDNQRKVLGSIWHHVRLLTIDSKKLIMGPLQNSLCTAAERRDFLKILMTPDATLAPPWNAKTISRQRDWHQRDLTWLFTEANDDNPIMGADRFKTCLLVAKKDFVLKMLEVHYGESGKSEAEVLVEFSDEKNKVKEEHIFRARGYTATTAKFYITKYVEAFTFLKITFTCLRCDGYLVKRKTEDVLSAELFDDAICYIFDYKNNIDAASHRFSSRITSMLLNNNCVLKEHVSTDTELMEAFETAASVLNTMTLMLC